MASITFLQLFAPTQISNAADTLLYTVPSTPAGTILRNARIRFANTSAGAVTIKGWAVPSAGVTGDGNLFLPTTSIAANSYIDVDVPVLTTSSTIQARAGAATSITATCLDGFLQS